MCRDEQRPVVDAATIRTQVSEGARAMVKLVYPEMDVTDPVFFGASSAFLNTYGDNIVVDTNLFVGMYPLLEELEANQIPWGIVTNKPRGLSESLLAIKPDRTLRGFGLSRRCHAKPNPTLNRCIWQRNS